MCDNMTTPPLIRDTRQDKERSHTKKNLSLGSSAKGCLRIRIECVERYCGSLHAPPFGIARLEGKIKPGKKSSSLKSDIGRVGISPRLAGRINHGKRVCLEPPFAAHAPSAIGILGRRRLLSRRSVTSAPCARSLVKRGNITHGTAPLHAHRARLCD